MKNRNVRLLCMTMAAVLAGGINPISARADEWHGWAEIDGKLYWYEEGVRQGYDENNPDYRGKEIYDFESDAWYWLDNVQQGAKAVSKDVYQESEAGAWGDQLNEDGKRYGKWVRYDENGHMIKGWNENEAGKYYFDPTYGTMAKGTVTIDGVEYTFNQDTGVLESGGEGIEYGWLEIDGKQYWYENWVRQGYDANDPDYRGKEIYDPESQAWYWLDNVQQGAKAVSKDVYQESQADDAGTIGKWVRYDENGHMVKGWNEKDGNKYYFNPVYGTMAKGIVMIDGKRYEFDRNDGRLIGEVDYDVVTYYSWRNEKSETLDADGNVTGYTVYEYVDDRSYNWNKSVNYDKEDNVTGSYERTFNDNGNVLSEVNKDADGQVTSAYYYKYNDAGRRIWYSYQYRSYDYVNGNRVSYNSRSEHFYNDNGNETEYVSYRDDVRTGRRVTEYNAEGLPTESRSYSYDTDENGNEIETFDSKTAYQNEGGHNVSSVYYSMEKQEDGTYKERPYSRNEYKYDDKGNVIEEVSYYASYYGDEEWMPSSRSVSTYTERGNMLEEVSYRWDSTAKDWKESDKSVYEYETYNAYGSHISEYRKSYFSYSSRYGEDGLYFSYGWENVRNDKGSTVKMIYYTIDKEIDYYWLYDQTVFPAADENSVGTIITKTNEKFDKDDQKIGGQRTVYRLVSYEEIR